MSATDDELYIRGSATLLASWAQYACRILEDVPRQG